MERRKPSQYRFTFSGHGDSDEAPVTVALLFSDQAVARSALDEPHDGVVPFLQELRELRNRGPAASGVASNPQEQLVLLGCHPQGTRRVFTKSQKTTEFVSKPRQAGEFLRRQDPGMVPDGFLNPHALII